MQTTDFTPQTPVAPEHHSPEHAGIRRLLMLTILLLALFSAAVFFSVFRDQLIKPAAYRDASDYSVVTLTNGSMYFGKLAEANQDYVSLTKVFYIETQNQANQENGAQKTNPQLYLKNMQDVFYKPGDLIKINRSQIVYYQPLQKDSAVVKKIEDYLAGKIQMEPAPSQSTDQQKPAN